MIQWPYTVQGCVKPVLMVSVSFLDTQTNFYISVVTTWLNGCTIEGEATNGLI